MGAAAIPIVAAVSAASAGYGIYAGERARSEQARQYRESRQQAAQQRSEEQRQLGENEARQQQLYDQQVAEQKATEDRLRAEQTGAISKARGEVPGIQARLGENLLKEQERAYTRMAPQLEARLNALGLLQSGALPEAQAKAQSDLEGRRQAALSDFGISAERELAIDRPLAASSEDVARQYGGMQRNLDTAATNLSQTFANQNAAQMNETARQQYLAGLAAAQNAAAQSSANAYLDFGGKVGSGLIQAYGQRQQPQNQSLKALQRSRGGGPYASRYGPYA